MSVGTWSQETYDLAHKTKVYDNHVERTQLVRVSTLLNKTLKVPVRRFKG